MNKIDTIQNHIVEYYPALGQLDADKRMELAAILGEPQPGNSFRHIVDHHLNLVPYSEGVFSSLGIPESEWGIPRLQSSIPAPYIQYHNAIASSVYTLYKKCDLARFGSNIFFQKQIPLRTVEGKTFLFHQFFYPFLASANSTLILNLSKYILIREIDLDQEFVDTKPMIFIGTRRQFQLEVELEKYYRKMLPPYLR